jgi:hypothetical protein
VSVIDELKGLEDRVARRMQELRPLVDEYRELEQVAERLGVNSSAAADAAPARPARARRTTRRARPKARTAATRSVNAAATATGTAAPGRTNGRREQLLDMVKARPGITVREIGAELGVDPTSLYRIVHRLEKDGALQKRGRELVPS